MPTYWQAFAPLVLFTFVASVTPGPNNMMLASSGLTHGFRRTIPHMLGFALGFVLMVVILGQIGRASGRERGESSGAAGTSKT